MTSYIAAYDTESPRCLEHMRTIIAMHRKHAMPATFFITGKTIEGNPAEYRKILDDPLFEIATHTYSHKSLRDHPFCGPAVPLAEIREEIARGKELVESAFERPCLGVRPGCSFENALHGATDVLGIVREVGLRYVSSMAWGKDWSLPAPVRNQAHTYEADGFPDIWELPCHGWHENLLKDNNKWGPRRITLWPPEHPDEIPTGFLKGPEDEVALNRVFLERAVRDDRRFVSLIWHPWSLGRFDPEMRMLDGTFRLVRDMHLAPTTYAGLLDEVAKD